jgi:hypothetical protein
VVEEVELLLLEVMVELLKEDLVEQEEQVQLIL